MIYCVQAPFEKESEKCEEKKRKEKKRKVKKKKKKKKELSIYLLEHKFLLFGDVDNKFVDLFIFHLEKEKRERKRKRRRR